MKLVLWAAFCLAVFLQTPALAQTDIVPESFALLCFDPASGEQTTIDQSSGAERCPKGYQAYPLLRFEQVAGAPPLNEQKAQQPKEGHDAQAQE